MYTGKGSSVGMRQVKAFTLVELMVVMAILGLLATVTVVSLIPRLMQAKQDVARVQMEEVSKAIKLFYLDHGRLPVTLQELEVTRGKYLEKGVPMDPWDHDYIYRVPGADREYDLICTGTDGVEGGEGDHADFSLYDAVKKR
jgi:general secretion pathway protein G